MIQQVHKQQNNQRNEKKQMAATFLHITKLSLVIHGYLITNLEQFG